MRHYTLVIVLQLFITAAAAVYSGSVTAKLHHPVTLPCDSACPGSLTWTLLHKRGVLARCDQTTCSTVEGFMISHDQYLKGNPHLTISAADYSMRGTYTCECDGTEVHRVRVFIETEDMTREITPGETIDVFLPLTDLVEVRFTPSDVSQPSDLHICTVNHEKSHCSPDYTQRVSRHNTLQIKGGRVSDSGLYTVWDTVNEETLATVNITVRGSPGEQKSSGLQSGRYRRSVPEKERQCPECKRESSVPVWLFVVTMVVMVILLMVTVSVIIYLWKENRRLRTENTHTHVEMKETVSEPQEQELISGEPST